MAYSALDDKSQVPTEEALVEVLGSAKELWDGLREGLAHEFEPTTEKWGYAGKKWGWSLGVKRRKRTIVYMTPAVGFLHAGFALGEKAVAVARQAGLAASSLEIIESARSYAEGRAVRLEVHTGEDVAQVLAIATAKMST